MLGYLLACIALVAIPIIAVQYPRYLVSLPQEPSSETSSVEPNLDGAANETPVTRTASDAALPTQPWQARGQSGQSGPVSSSTRGYDMKAKEKPWHPPFPRSGAKGKREPYCILASSTELGAGDPRDTERGSSIRKAHGVGEGGGMKVLERVQATEPLGDALLGPQSTLNLAVPEPSRTPHAHPPKRSQSPTDAPNERRSCHISLLQSLCLALAFLIFVFAFAILVAHSLAWFIVYKTESRLGDARRGLLRGGDMRICLCAKG